ncbi:hypothetical protein A8990_10414 [Paenibacillus taihuensis]|uniref:Hydrolase n=1 Tax=Paenibacillus taihuensis TaxID=1156355 RepID=A0A3D9SC87_9BACL|nr:hypothetical protein [Paenibacillus taihuensis]REE91507.1 hypothetical protein A8990_10414 [Paenibacillus taihuensis]
MEKRKYYVSVQSKCIMFNQGDAAYELEIYATEDEVEKLRGLFNDWERAEEHTFFRTHYPGIPYHHDMENDEYDFVLKEIYQTISDIGTEETKNFIASMDLQMGAPKEF